MKVAFPTRLITGGKADVGAGEADARGEEAEVPGGGGGGTCDE